MTLILFIVLMAAAGRPSQQLLTEADVVPAALATTIRARAPGAAACAVSAGRGGGRIHSSAMGPQSDRAVAPAHWLDVHSEELSQLVVHWLVLDAIAAGLIDIDSPVGGVVSELRALGDSLDVRAVLGGRSGLRDVRDVLHLRRRGERAVATIPEALHWIGLQRARSSRGTGPRRKTASDSVVLTALLEGTYGKPLAVLVRDRLTEPLGLHGSGFRGPHPNGPTGRLHGFEGFYVTAPDLVTIGLELVDPRFVHPRASAWLLHARGIAASGGTPLGWAELDRTAWGRPLFVFGSAGPAALAVLPDSGWSIAAVDREATPTPISLVKQVALEMAPMFSTLSGARPGDSMLVMGGGSGSRYSGATSRVPPSSLEGSFHLPEVGLRFDVEASDDQLELSLEGWPPIRTDAGFWSPAGDGRTFHYSFRGLTGRGQALSASLAIQEMNGTWRVTHVSLDQAFQRHGTLQNLAVERHR